MNILRIIRSAAAVIVLSALVSAPARAQDDAMERVRKILTTTPLFDGHNDLPWEIRNQDAAPKDVAAYDLRTRTTGHTESP